jgi:hypothetical protein
MGSLRIIPVGLILIICLGAVSVGCSGTSGSVSPIPFTNYPDTPREVLAAFADACIAQDIDAACGYMAQPMRWRRTMELASDMLPLMGQSLEDAKETRRERDCYRYRMRLRHPDDPRQRELISTVYVVRNRDLDGVAGRWGVDFVRVGSGDGASRRLGSTADPAQLLPDERTGQWGTMYTHASILTRAIINYYFRMYPEDYEFTGQFGFFRPANYHYLNTLATHPGPIETILGFDYDIYENMPPDAVLILNACGALVQAGSADEDVFVGEYNEDGSINYLRDIVLTIDGEAWFVTSNDFGEDDDTFLKGFAHFLTPLTQDIWQTEFAAFDDMSILGGTGNASVKALDWALGDGTLGPYDILGIVDLRASRNRKTLQRAIDLLKQAHEEQDGIARANLLANSFYTFGYTLHLLEDQSCPAHCRNDMHGVPIISSIPGLGSLQPDPAEEWGESLSQSFVNETVSLFMQMLAEHDPIVRTPTGFENNPILQNLYDNAEHPDFAAVEALFEYTSLIANRMCFSEDTIYTSTNPDAANTDYWPDLTALDLDFFGKTVVYGTPGPEISGDQYIAGCGNGMFDVWRTWFWTTHWFEDPEIGDVEDALHNGWDILTVADDDDDDYFSNGVLGIREQQWRLLFPLSVKTGAAYMHEWFLATR